MEAKTKLRLGYYSLLDRISKNDGWYVLKDSRCVVQMYARTIEEIFGAIKGVRESDSEFSRKIYGNKGPVLPDVEKYINRVERAGFVAVDALSGRDFVNMEVAPNFDLVVSPTLFYPTRREIEKLNVKDLEKVGELYGPINFSTMYQPFAYLPREVIIGMKSHDWEKHEGEVQKLMGGREKAIGRLVKEGVVDPFGEIKE